MKKIVLQLTTIAIILLLGACSNDEIIEKNDNNPALTTGRTLSLTAAMPGDNSDNPTTRVDLEQLGDKSIELTWEQTDELQLVFVQGDIKRKGIATVKNITEEGKKAQFDIVIPDGITDEVFDLYGIYGGGGLDDADPTKVILPTNPGEATSLNTEGSSTSVKSRKDVMLYFQSTGIETASPKVYVVFNHLGSLFSITVKNSSSSSIINLDEARLIGVGNWAYNSATSAQCYDLVSGEFQNPETASSYISFKAENCTIQSGESISFWGWYPPLPDKIWPELKLQLAFKDGTTTTGVNSLPKRTEATAAGKSFYFYAIWDDAQFGFTDEAITPLPPLGSNVYYVPKMGTLGSMIHQSQKDTITTMIIKGEINKADFEVMKKEIPNLTYVDLSAVTCENNEIPQEAFGDWNNPNLKISTIILPESITTIGKSAFVKCSGLTGTLTIPKNVTTIDVFAFKECSGFNELILPDGLTTIKQQAFSDCKGFTGSLNLPPGLTTIEYRTFMYCSGFESLILPTELITIENTAFYGCSGFKGALTIPDKVTTIELSAFYGCSGFDGLLTLSKELTTIEGEAFSGCSGFTGTLTIPDKVTMIGDGAFEGCSKLTGHLTIPDGVTTIGSYAFSGCSGFTGSLTLHDELVTIGANAFYGCSGFDGLLTLSKELTTISSYAFSGCSGFTGKVVFPENLTYIGINGFSGCNNISAFRFPHTTPIAYSDAMLNEGTKVEVPASARAKYKAAEGWKDHPIAGYLPLEGGIPGM